MKITIDPDKCICCNVCGSISEGAVGTEYGSEGKAGFNPAADLTDRVVMKNIKLAVETCPMMAITIEE